RFGIHSDGRGRKRMGWRKESVHVLEYFAYLCDLYWPLLDRGGVRLFADLLRLRHICVDDRPGQSLVFGSAITVAKDLLVNQIGKGIFEVDLGTQTRYFHGLDHCAEFGELVGQGLCGFGNLPINIAEGEIIDDAKAQPLYSLMQIGAEVGRRCANRVRSLLVVLRRHVFAIFFTWLGIEDNPTALAQSLPI